MKGEVKGEARGGGEREKGGERGEGQEGGDKMSQKERKNVSPILVSVISVLAGFSDLSDNTVAEV